MAQNSPLARIWRLIFDILEEHGTSSAGLELEKLVWLPAHGPQCSIGRVYMSNGDSLSAIHWRASRLVDWLAKGAAQPWRIKKNDRTCISTVEDAISYSLAKLGAVTFAAKNSRTHRYREDGSAYPVVLRDSAGAKPFRFSVGIKGKQACKRRQPAISPITEVPGSMRFNLVSQAPALAKRRKRLSARQAELEHEERSETAFRMHWRAEAAPLRAHASFDARDRMARLRERIRERVHASESFFQAFLNSDACCFY